MKSIFKLWAVFVVALALIHPGSAAAKPVAPQFPAFMKEQLKFLSTGPMLLRAEAMGVTVIEGKNITEGGQGENNEGLGVDVPVGADPAVDENEPTVASNPTDDNRLVAGSHHFPDAGCAAYTSPDSGVTWSSPQIMPLLTADSFCSDPVLAYAPDGKRVYYAYMDVKFLEEVTPTTIVFTEDLDILVSYSDNNGKTWKGPVIALNGDPTIFTFDLVTFELLEFDPGFSYDKPWISTNVDQSQKKWAYITATRFDSNLDTPSDCHITFTRSGNKGTSWGAPVILDSSSGGCGDVVVQGSRPAGGVGNNVLVAWYHSGGDGWLNGNFAIRTRLSTNNGTSWNNIVTAATDSYELPFWLGPMVFYHRWWGGMFPDLDIDDEGAAHIAYTHDPAANPFPGFSDTPEDGDIRYITSTNPPYNSWSAPLTINDDGMERAQGWATLETRTENNVSTVYMIWEDHRLSPDVPIEFPNSPNLYYDIFSAKKEPGSSSWAANARVTDVSSISDFIFVGDYFDLAPTDEFFFGIWTDRRDKTDIFDLEDDVYGSWRLE